MLYRKIEKGKIGGTRTISDPINGGHRHRAGTATELHSKRKEKKRGRLPHYSKKAKERPGLNFKQKTGALLVI